MPQRISIEEYVYVAELAAREPHFDRDAKRFMERRGRPRKMPVLCDENLEEEVIGAVRGYKKFKVRISPKTISDSLVWQTAQINHFIVLTADVDFWNDRQYPLRTSPGLMLLSDNSGGERIGALARILTSLRLPETYFRDPDFFFRSKIRASEGGGTLKFLARDSRVVQWDI